MTTKTTITFPDDISNPNSRQALHDKYTTVYFNLDKALRSLKTAAPPVYAFKEQGEEAYTAATIEHAQRVYKLHTIAQEIWQLAKYLDDK